MKRSALVVGAGFAGATYARVLAEAGWRVQVIDRRPHVAGNAYDEISCTGIRIHAYGPHLFHTNNEQVVEWLRQFGKFVPYMHKVQALLPWSERCVPLPINRITINQVFGVSLPDAEEVQAFLRRIAVPCEAPRNASEYLNSKIGIRLTDLFFRPYTKKMWDLDLEDMDAAIVKRIPLRYDDSDAYFPDDKFQMLPCNGYTALFSNILAHPAIAVQLSTSFDHGMLQSVDACFNSMPIDEFFDFRFGPLPYRSIRFHHREEASEYVLGGTSVVNFTDDRQFTRQTDWSRLPMHSMEETGRKTITLEEPCDYRSNNMERYYPIKTSDGRYHRVYRQYKQIAELDPKVRFIGRCGTYQYLDMHQVISQSLKGARDFLAGR